MLLGVNLTKNLEMNVPGRPVPPLRTMQKDGVYPAKLKFL